MLPAPFFGLLIALLAAVGCGGVANETPASVDAGRRADAARDSARTDAHDAEASSSVDAADAPSLPVYVEDACPPSKPSPPSYACDPFTTSTGQCPAGSACYPVPPSGT